MNTLRWNVIFSKNFHYVNYKRFVNLWFIILRIYMLGALRILRYNLFFNISRDVWSSFKSTLCEFFLISSKREVGHYDIYACPSPGAFINNKKKCYKKITSCINIMPGTNFITSHLDVIVQINNTVAFFCCNYFLFLWNKESR